MGQDSKGTTNARVNKLSTDNKTLQGQIEKMNLKKKQSDQEISQLQSKVKKIETELAEKKKSFATKQSEFEAEKNTWENKYKQFNNELRKKDNVLKKYSEISSASTPKDAHIINSVEIIGDLSRQGSQKVYGGAEVNYSYTKPFAEFMSFCNEKTREEFDIIRKENDTLREQLSEVNLMMDEIVKVRKSILERKINDNEQYDNQIMVQIKNELLNLKESDLESSSLAVLKDNMRKFRDFIDKVDSANFGLPLDKAYQFNPDSEIDEIKSLKRLKDLVSIILINNRKL